MKTTSARTILSREEKTVMTGSRIGHVWLMNSVNWPVRALSVCEVVKKAWIKSKNDILHARLGHIGETHNKKIISMIDDIDKDPSKISFCKSYIGSKITWNPSREPMSKVTTKLGRVHMDLWGPSPDISLEKNCYMWTATDQATSRVWTDFWPNKKELL